MKDLLVTILDSTIVLVILLIVLIVIFAAIFAVSHYYFALPLNSIIALYFVVLFGAAKLWEIIKS